VFELSDQARQQGAIQLNLETVYCNSAEMERILRGEIFAGRSVGELIFPSCAASFGFLLIGLAFAIPRDRARRRQRDEGTRLKGPQLVTVEEFNRWSGSDGINFMTTERKRSLSIPRSLESTCAKGKRFPPCRDCSHPRFVLKRKAHHIETHEFFSHYYRQLPLGSMAVGETMAWRKLTCPQDSIPTNLRYNVLLEAA